MDNKNELARFGFTNAAPFISTSCNVRLTSTVPIAMDIERNDHCNSSPWLLPLCHHRHPKTFPKIREDLAKILRTDTEQALGILDYLKNKDRPLPEVPSDIMMGKPH